VNQTPINPPKVEPPLWERSTIDATPLWERVALGAGVVLAGAAMLHPVSRAAILGGAAAVGRGAAAVGRGAAEVGGGAARLYGRMQELEEMVPPAFDSPQSTAIAGAQWDGHTVTIFWRHGGANDYPCNREMWVGFYQAGSKGGYYNDTWA